MSKNPDYKIENVGIKATPRYSIRLRGFLLTLRNLEVGQSFVTDVKSTERMVLSMAGFLLDRHYVTNKQGMKGHKSRVGRIA